MNEVEVNVQWVENVAVQGMSSSIVSLVDCATQDGGTLGYSQPLTAPEAQNLLGDLQRRIDHGASHVLLGHTGTDPVFLAVLTQSNMDNCKHRAELSKGVIHPNYRGRSLVKLAFSELTARAKFLGVDQLVLDVREGSRAHALWLRFGFTTYGTLDDYARIDGVSYRGCYMMQPVHALRARLSMNDRHLYREQESLYAC
jgi:ribosomal protein S18 acetylase RimI-like enzyme